MTSPPVSSRSLAARRTSIAMNGGTNPRLEIRITHLVTLASVLWCVRGCHLRVALAMRGQTPEPGMGFDLKYESTAPDWHVRQPARRLVFECGAGDLAREVRRPR